MWDARCEIIGGLPATFSREGVGIASLLSVSLALISSSCFIHFTTTLRDNEDGEKNGNIGGVTFSPF